MNENYDTWITNLMTGTQSAEDEAARAKFRAMTAAQAVQPRRAAAPVIPSAAAMQVAGPNTWAAYRPAGDEHTLTTYTLLDGPGRFANCLGHK